MKVTTQPEFFWTKITETSSMDPTSNSNLNANVKQDEERQEMDSFDAYNLIERAILASAFLTNILADKLQTLWEKKLESADVPSDREYMLTILSLEPDYREK